MSDTQTDQMSDVVQTAFIFAARYVHHRNTGGTLAVCRALSEVWPQLSQRVREQILRESYEATCNLDDWEEFRKGLNAEVCHGAKNEKS